MIRKEQQQRRLSGHFLGHACINIAVAARAACLADGIGSKPKGAGRRSRWLQCVGRGILCHPST